MSNGYLFGDVADNFQLYFSSQRVLYGTSLLNTNNSFIGIAYGVYDAFTDTLTLYDFVTDTPVGQINNYGLKFSYFRTKRIVYIVPNIFTRFYYNEDSNYILNRSWDYFRYVIPSCAEFLLTLSMPIVALSYLIYNGYILTSEGVQNVNVHGSIEGHSEISNLFFNVSFFYSIPQYGYPSCYTSILVTYPSTSDNYRITSEATITLPTQWYAPLILSDIGVYAVKGSNFSFAKIGGLYSPYAVYFYNGYTSGTKFYQAFIIAEYVDVLSQNPISHVGWFLSPKYIVIGLPYELEIRHLYPYTYDWRTYISKGLENYIPPYIFNVYIFSQVDVYPVNLPFFGSNIILQ